MYIATVRNRNSPPAILLRESYREAGKVKTRTLANLTKLPGQAIEVLRASLKGQPLAPASETFKIIASPHHGHVQAVLGAMRRLGFDDGTPTHSFRTLLTHLSSIVRNTCQLPDAPAETPTFHVVTTPNPKQQQAFELLEKIRA